MYISDLLYTESYIYELVPFIEHTPSTHPKNVHSVSVGAKVQTLSNKLSLNLM